MKSRYGINLETYNNMLVDQENKCPLCSRSFDEVKIHIDHCHKTGKVRGLLCEMCNKGLGHFKDDPEIIRSAINYLKNG